MALEEISRGLNTSDELIEKIVSLFSNQKISGIELSTIHKAKGLESNNVFICCPSLLPSKNAKEDWEIEQERNLEYVAYTRAKENLSFLDESNFKNFARTNKEKANEIEKIINKINALYNSGNRCEMKLSSESAKQIIKNAQPINPLKENTIDLGKINKNSSQKISIPKRKVKKKR